MARDRIDLEAVLKALDEYDRMGRDAFLTEHDFEEARQFYVQHKGKLYDAKAIANVAYRYQYGAPPNPPISGGQADANRRLSALGFAIVDLEPETDDGRRICRRAMWSHMREWKARGDRVPLGGVALALRRVEKADPVTPTTCLWRSRSATAPPDP